MNSKIYDFLEKKDYVATLIIILILGISAVTGFMLTIRAESNNKDEKYQAEIKLLNIEHKREVDSTRISCDNRYEDQLARERETSKERLEELTNRVNRVEGVSDENAKLANINSYKSNRNRKVAVATNNLIDQKSDEKRK